MFDTFTIPSWSLVKNPCHYQNRNANRMIITVGDSWTYGDSLGATCVREGRDDTKHRLAHVYGNLISEELDADWINLALPGISNRMMFIWLEQLLARRMHSTDTTCVITLTESGRHEELQWLDRHLTTLQTNLENMVDRTYAWLAQIQARYPSVRFVVAHNFTDSRATNKIAVCPRTWLEIMLNEQIQNGTHVVVSEHIKQLNYDHTYSDTPAVIDRAINRIELLEKCKYCHRHDSRHPTEYGHELWANYLLSQL
jgi:hypothetical protein